MKNPWVIIGVIFVVLFGSAVWYGNRATENYNEGVVFSPHVKGNPDAAVTLTEYSDLQCPACASFQPAITEVLNTYGDQLRFEYRHFPLLTIHPHALEAAIAAEAAGQQGKFFEFHDVLFAKQSEWSGVAVPQTYFAQYAADLELDVELFRRHLRSSLIEEKVRAEFAEARALGLTGTPTFLLNGERMEFDSYERFLGLIAAAVDPASSTASSSGPAVQFGL